MQGPRRWEEEDLLTGVVLRDMTSHEEDVRPADASFITIGAVPHAGRVPSAIARDAPGSSSPPAAPVRSPTTP
jgi:hypothetical protein